MGRGRRSGVSLASLGHVAVGMAAGRLWTSWSKEKAPTAGPSTASSKSLARAMVAFSALSMAPDLEVIAFRFHVPYSAPFGHRGAARSIATALAFATASSLATRLTPKPLAARQTWILCAAVAVSHGLSTRSPMEGSASRCCGRYPTRGSSRRGTRSRWHRLGPRCSQRGASAC